MFADAILLLAHTVSAMRHMLKICDLYARMPLTMM